MSHNSGIYPVMPRLPDARDAEERREDAPGPGQVALRQAGQGVDVLSDTTGFDRKIAAHTPFSATRIRSGGRTKQPHPGTANTLAPS